MFASTSLDDYYIYNNCMRIVIMGLVVLLNQCISVHAETRAYHIGNSHTWNARPAKGLRNMFADSGVAFSNDWHIACGQSLSYMVENPGYQCVDSLDYIDYIDALTSEVWDVVTIQTYHGESIEVEKDAVADIIRLLDWRATPEQTSVFLYCTWPPNRAEPLAGFDYTPAWEELHHSVAEDCSETRSFYIYLLKSLRDKYPEYSIDAIPVGEVLNRFHIAAKEGQIPDFSGAGELYDGIHHMNNVGRYLASLCVFSAITGTPVSGTSIPSGYAPRDKEITDRPLTPDLANIITALVDQVFSEEIFHPDISPLSLDQGESMIRISCVSYLGFGYDLFESEDLIIWNSVKSFEGGGILQYDKARDVVSRCFWKLKRY